jgi:dTDP-4-dehydrorhamnose reductase
MILLLGSRGYVGSAFAAALRSRNVDYLNPSRDELNILSVTELKRWLRTHRPAFVINSAGYTGQPNVDACETRREDTLSGNVELPRSLGRACAELGIPFGHVSSGCIYTGCLVEGPDGPEVERDVNCARVRALAASSPGKLRGFDEDMPPNFTPEHGPCSFYSHTKALGEAALAGLGQHYVWRLRIPFDEADGARNYLSKLQRYSRAYRAINSLSHRADFVDACLDSWQRDIPRGIYNVVNPGFLPTEDVVDRLRTALRLDRSFDYWANDEEFYRLAARTPRSNCLLDSGKLLRAGVRMRPLTEALDDALGRWRWEAARA